MSPIRPAFKLFGWFSVILSVSVISAWTALQHPTPMKIIFRVGLVNTLVSAFWWLFDTRLWRIPSLRKFEFLNIPPDLNGRWVGTLKREGSSEAPHPFVMEIFQTYSRVAVITYSSQSKSLSISAQFVSDESRTVFQLIHSWQAETRRMDDPEKSDEFYGTSIIEIENPRSATAAEKTLRDHYFTRRIPHTRGRIEAKWNCAELLGKF